MRNAEKLASNITANNRLMQMIARRPPVVLPPNPNHREWGMAKKEIADGSPLAYWATIQPDGSVYIGYDLDDSAEIYSSSFGVQVPARVWPSMMKFIAERLALLPSPPSPQPNTQTEE